ncbi:MAG: fold metallo-hydrolase, partial [Enterovirga sp.]|nr:fold metallo-hydrolase [Enterovirga sp.]
HLAVHADFARKQGVANVVKARNGTVVKLAPGTPEVIQHVPAGRLYRDGDIVTGSLDRAIPERRKLAFAGVISVAIAIDQRGELAGDPAVEHMGIPERTRSGEAFATLIDAAIAETLNGLPRARRRDPEAIEESVSRAVRGVVRAHWGKKPACHVLVVEV